MKQITLEGSNVIFSFPFSWDTKEDVKRLGAMNVCLMAGCCMPIKRRLCNGH